MVDNIKISYFNCTDKFKKKYLEYFKSANLVDVNFDTLISNVKNEVKESNKLFRDYIIFKYLYDNGGMVLDGNFEFIKTINSFFNNDFFIGFYDDKDIATNIVWAKEKNNKIVKEVLDIIKQEKYDNITDVFSEITKKDLHNNYNYVLKFDENSFIYPYDYFYPIDYEKIGKAYTSNIKALFFDNNKKLSFRQRNKLKTLRRIGPTACEYLFTTLRRFRYSVGHKKYIFMQNLKRKISVKKDAGIEETINTLDKYLEAKKNGQDIEYLIIHNPNWLGVTSATKELFENLLPMQEVFLNSNVDTIVNKIIELDVNQVIFSAFNYGWDKIAIKLREKCPKIKLKSFWHGSHSQVIEEINWGTNLMVINLHKAGVIDVMGTCKASLVNFYNSQGYKSAFIKNTVRLTDDVKEKIAKAERKNDGKLKFGLYSASTDWRKNTFNQVMAASSFENAELEVVPLKYELKKLAYYNELEIVGSNTHLKREDLLVRMAQRDVVLYVTFSECAPMLPIEALEAGTLCIMGHNHHYFQGTKLHDYLVVEREDDLNAIKEKIKIALDHKDEIMQLYKEWKEQNDKESTQSVIDFLNM
mgnify:FL=1